MRHPSRLLLLALLASCGGGDSTSPPPPPPPPASQVPGAPASLTATTGSGQTASPAGKVAVKPAVVVRDASGRAVPGVAVSFAIETGGGAIEGASATTGGDGVATSGDWTLGPAEGDNSLRVTSGALTPVVITAQAVFPAIILTDTTIAPTGGTVTIRRAGDPLDGLTIRVPAGAYSVPTRWSVTAYPGAPAPLPAGFTQVGPTMVVSNGQGYASDQLTLTMPMALTPDIAVTPFYYDPATGTLEGIPLVTRSATSATLATRHFSRDLMAIPGGSAALNASGLNVPLGFGNVAIVWVKTPTSNLVGTFASTFHPGVDDWEFENQGSFIAPGGDCEGMSITAIYYHYFQKSAGAPGLYHRFDLTLPNVMDNVQGRRFAASVQGDYLEKFYTGVSQTKALIDQGVSAGISPADLAASWILMTLKINHSPLLLALHNSTSSHAVVVYGATSTGSKTDVMFADPNVPGVIRTMTFQAGALVPVQLATKAKGPPVLYPRAYALAVTAEVPLTQLKSRYAEFIQQKAGVDRYPDDDRIEAYDMVTDTWVAVGSTFQTTDQDLKLRYICPVCLEPKVGGELDEQFLYIWNGGGTTFLAEATIPNKPGTTSYYAELAAYSSLDPSHEQGFVDARPFTVTYQEMKVDPPNSRVAVGVQTTFTVDAGSLATPGSTYEWKVSDGSAPVVATITTFSYSFSLLGANKVEVTLKDATGRKVARSVVKVFVDANLTISPSPLTGNPGVPVAMTAVVQGTMPTPAPKKIEYVWEISDAGTVVAGQTTTVPTVTFTFGGAGIYEVQYFLMLDGVQTGASRKVPVDIKAIVPVPVWRFTVMNENVSGPSVPDIFQVLQGYIGQDIGSLMEPIWAVPRSGRLFYKATSFTAGSQTFPAGVYVMGGFTSNTDAAFNPSRPFAPLARATQGPYPDAFGDALSADAATLAGDLSNGTFGGKSATHTRDLNPFAQFGGVGGIHTVTHWEVTATKNGTQLTGKITYFLEQWVPDAPTCNPQGSLKCAFKFGGTLKWEFPFTAVRVQ